MWAAFSWKETNSLHFSEGDLHYNQAMTYPGSPYQGQDWAQDVSFSYSEEGGMTDDNSMGGFDPSTININEILGIASTMVTGNQMGSMDIN